MVLQKDAESSMDGQKDERGGVTNGGNQKGTDDKNQVETVRLPMSSTERRGLEKDCFMGMVEGRRARGRQNELYGWNQRTSWIWKDGRCAEIC